MVKAMGGASGREKGKDFGICRKVDLIGVGVGVPVQECVEGLRGRPIDASIRLVDGGQSAVVQVSACQSQS